MPKLQPPESHRVSAALGWLELGNATEAKAELDGLPADLRECPEVLFVRWEVEAKQRDWASSLDTARALISVAPEEPDGWIKQSYSLHELKRTREAWDSLAVVEARFPHTSIIPYNLACYACQLGDSPEAMRRLGKALKLGGKDQIKAMALQDLDLKPLWDDIRNL
jgi:predicted Zn-dependent protease